MTDCPQSALIAYVDEFLARQSASTPRDTLLPPGSVLDRLIRDPRMQKVWRKLAPLTRAERCKRSGREAALLGFARDVAGAAEGSKRLHAMTLSMIRDAYEQVVAACSRLDEALQKTSIAEPSALDAIEQVKREAEVRVLAAATSQVARTLLMRERKSLLADVKRGTAPAAANERLHQLETLASIWTHDPEFNPRVIRTAGTKTGRVRHLVRTLAEHTIPYSFREVPNRGVIATIATVVLEQEISALAVRDMLEGRRNRREGGTPPT